MLTGRRSLARWIEVVRSARRFMAATRGVAATEFAMIAPALILVYVGAAELTAAVMTSRRVDLLSRTLTDLTSQQLTSQQATSTPPPSNAITQGTLSNIFTASTAILAPATTTASLKMTITAVDVVNKPSGLCCNFNVRWSYTQSGSLRACGTPLLPVSPSQAPTPTTVPSSLTPPTTTLPSPVALLIADVAFPYQPPFAPSWLSFASAMTKTTYMLPRNTGQVILQGPVTASGTQSGAICY